ncbi:MAG: right-handed parallel beta-helix repeat-containing protein [Fibrobacterales bacterium]
MKLTVSNTLFIIIHFFLIGCLENTSSTNSVTDDTTVPYSQSQDISSSQSQDVSSSEVIHQSSHVFADDVSSSQRVRVITESKNTATIDFNVVDLSTAQKLGAVEVSWIDNGTTVVAYSDSLGYVSIEGLVIGSYTFVFIKEGFETILELVDLTEMQNSDMPVLAYIDRTVFMQVPTALSSAVEVSASSSQRVSSGVGEADAGVYYVTPLANVDGEGTMESPFLKIQDGVKAALGFGDGAKVMVAAGNYSLTTKITIDKDIELYGGYSQDDWDERDVEKYISKVETRYGDPTWASVFELNGNTIIDGFLISQHGIDVSFLNAINVEGGSPTIRNSTIHTMNLRGSFSSGIEVHEGTPLVYNNVIMLSGNTIPSAVKVRSGSFTQIYNNTFVVLEQDKVTFGTGVYLYDSSTVVIQNNAFVNFEIIVQESDLQSDVLEMKNNSATLYDKTGTGLFAVFYRDWDTDTVYDADGVEALTDVEASGNMLFDHMPYFVDYDGIDNDSATFADNNVQFIESTPKSILEGGAEVAQFSTDKRGVVRTAPWSIGAYEVD